MISHGSHWKSRLSKLYSCFYSRRSLASGARCLLLALLCFGIAASASCQTQWSIKDNYFSLNGQPKFLSGANYIPSHGWYLILKNWDPVLVERDMRALHEIGVIAVRFPPLWVLLQPTYGHVDSEELDHLNQLLTIAHRNGIAVQVEFFTGGVCGAIFLPNWADGNIFTDARIIRGEQELVKDLAQGLKANPGLLGYDFGNEVDILSNRMKLHPTPEQIRAWLGTIYQTAKHVDPNHTVTGGLASLHGNGTPFNLWDMAENTDYTTVHSYAYFDGTIKTDPWIGQRTLYDMNYAIAFSAMAGKPVLVQENGFSEGWIGSKEEIAKALRISLMSAWAQGAAGYFWWGSHDNDLNYRIPTSYVSLKYSQPSISQGIMKQLEYSEGLVDTDNQPKVYGLEYKHWSNIISKLGVGWTNKLPAAYLLYADEQDKGSDKTQLTAFTLAKQVHMDVKMWPEGKPIPSDASAVIIAGFALSPKGKAVVRNYLSGGGVVYQSWANDFNDDLSVADSGTTLSAPTLIADLPVVGIPHRNHLPFADGDHIRVNAELRVRDVASGPDPDTQVLLSVMQNASQEEAPRPVLFEKSVGKGKYYYLAANLEEALAKTYDPWAADQSNEIYAVLRPNGTVNISSKYVELYQKMRGSETILLLLNRSDSFQQVVLESDHGIALQDYVNKAQLGAGTEIPLSLSPGEVLVAEVTHVQGEKKGSHQNRRGTNP